MKTISKSISKGQHSVNYKEILKVDGVKLRIIIESDAYDFQSCARIQKWNGDEWHIIDSIHYSEMNTPYSLVYKACNQPRVLSPDTIMKNNDQFFKKDRDILIDIAREVILD